MDELRRYRTMGITVREDERAVDLMFDEHQAPVRRVVTHRVQTVTADVDAFEWMSGINPAVGDVIALMTPEGTTFPIRITSVEWSTMTRRFTIQGTVMSDAVIDRAQVRVVYPDPATLDDVFPDGDPR